MIDTEYNGELLVVVLRNGRPFSVATRHEGCNQTYDFEWCKAHAELYYDESGGGPTAFAEGARDDHWWARSDLREDVHILGVLAANRLKELPAEWRDPFRNAMDEDTTWCEICKDYWPDSDLCQHIWWCEECGWWTTPTEPCPHRKGTPEE